MQKSNEILFLLQICKKEIRVCVEIYRFYAFEFQDLNLTAV
jgi:hypothetical protein